MRLKWHCKFHKNGPYRKAVNFQDLPHEFVSVFNENIRRSFIIRQPCLALMEGLEVWLSAFRTYPIQNE